MRAIKLLTLIIAAFALTGCTKFKDGKYIVLNTKAKDDQFKTLPSCYDDTIGGKSIGGFLKQKFNKHSYALKFKKDFAVLTDLRSGKETILAAASDAIGDYYSTEESRGEGQERFNVQLRPNGTTDGLVLIVDLTVPWGMKYKPVQLGGKFLGGSPCGRAICYLSKLD